MKAFKTFMVILVIFLVCAAAFVAIIERIPHWSAQTVTLTSTTIAGTIVRKDEALLKLNSGGTGKAYIYDNGTWKPIENAPVKMDFSDVDKVTGHAGFDNEETFGASLYNGTGWRITSVILDINATCTNKENSFKRKYYQVTDFPPYSEISVKFNVSKPADLDKFSWGIDALYGVQEIQLDNNQQ